MASKEQSKKLTIAFLVERFPCISETFILNQILYLINQGHDVHIYSVGTDKLPVQPLILKYDLLAKTRYIAPKSTKLNFIKEALRVFIKSKNKLLLLKTLNPFKFGKDAYSLRNFFLCNTFVDSPAFDVVHAHFGPMGNYAVSLKKLGLLKNVPLITSFHGYDINPNYMDICRVEYKTLFHVSNLVTANSNFTLKLLKDADCNADKLVILHESLDTSYFQKELEQPKNNNLINVIFCGRYIDFKAPELVIEIANLLINHKGYKNVKFHMIGTGHLEQMVKDLISRYNLSEYVTLYGAMTQDDIIRKMSGMDVFLYPGIYDSSTGRAENQGLVLQEAQSMELPVITSNAGGIPEGVVDQETAFVLNERDIEGFTNKLELLINDNQLRLNMGKQGKAYVEKNFDYNVLGQTLEEYYYSTLPA